MRDKLMLAPRDRLIFACDYDNMPDAMKTLEELKGHITMVKIGMEMFTGFGPPILQAVKAMGFRVWLDLKFMDIPNTVKGAIKSAQAYDVDMITIHLLGGSEMIKAAVEVANSDDGPSPLILGVSILTSLSDDNLETMGFRYDLSHEVRCLVYIGNHAGVHGVVCSSHEVQQLRKMHPNLIIVTPGIRPTSYQQIDDQKRIATPGAAIVNGSDMIVVGRAIKNATNKEEVCTEIVNEIGEYITRRDQLEDM